MKKSLIFGLLAIMGLGMTSCNTCDCKHEPVIPCQFNKKTIDLVVSSDKWVFDSGANMYYCHFDVPELTQSVYNYGEVSINREYNSGSAQAYQVALPETSYLMLEEDNGDGTTSTYYYQQHIDYAYGAGFVEIFCMFSDYIYDSAPDPMLFRMQLTY